MEPNTATELLTAMEETEAAKEICIQIEDLEQPQDALDKVQRYHRYQNNHFSLRVSCKIV